MAEYRTCEYWEKLCPRDRCICVSEWPSRCGSCVIHGLRLTMDASEPILFVYGTLQQKPYGYNSPLLGNARPIGPAKVRGMLVRRTDSVIPVMVDEYNDSTSGRLGKHGQVIGQAFWVRDIGLQSMYDIARMETNAGYMQVMVPVCIGGKKPVSALAFVAGYGHGLGGHGWVRIDRGDWHTWYSKEHGLGLYL